jgi:hypothetical protein
MLLFWLVHEIDGEPRVMIREAGAEIFARLDCGLCRVRLQLPRGALARQFIQATDMSSAPCVRAPAHLTVELARLGAERLVPSH